MATKATRSSYSMILLDRRPIRKLASSSFRPKVITSKKGLLESISRITKDSIVISYDCDLTDAFLKSFVPGVTKLGTGLFIHKIDVKDILELSTLFRKSVFDESNGFVPAVDLAEILNAANRSDLAIGGIVNENTARITLWRGNLEPITIPFSAFEKSGDGSLPDFSDFSIIDCGQTVRLGQYEAALDAILYEHDPKFRRALTKNRLKNDRSFGASLLRLRKQRGLSRKDFEPEVSAKTIARIELGTVLPHRIHKSTLAVIARILKVNPEEIETF